MIISASRRTDIPAYFSDWFINRIKDQYAYVRNPMNIHQVSKINLSPEIVDCIVFWSKNPKPMLNRLDDLQDYAYYFQFTLNPYEKDVEKHLPPLRERINTFIELSNIIGKEKVVWRYDPIILSSKYTISWHMEHFKQLADELKNYTEKCTFSYIDLYTKISNNIKGLNIYELSLSDKQTLAKEFSYIAHACNLDIDTCAEDIDLSLYNVNHARCIDDKLIARILNCSIDIDKDKNQRLTCGCAASVDLGLYNTCQNGCLYCYANHNNQTLKKNYSAYNRNSPLLCSEITELDKISERKVKSQKNAQLNLFSL